MPRASHVQLKGSINSTISDNEFAYQIGIYSRVFSKDSSKRTEEITNLTRYLPPNYFSYLQTPLVGVVHPEAAENVAGKTNLTTTFERNNFQGLFFAQPILDSQPMLGAIMQV